MRSWPVLLMALVGAAAPRLASACSYGPCHENPRWSTAEPLHDGPIPTDGVLALSGFVGSETCLDALAPLFTVSVAGPLGPVAGALDAAPGLRGAIFWRPAAAFAPHTTYTARFVLNNLALGPSENWTGEACGLDEIVAQFEFTTGGATPALPPPESPALALVTETIDQEFTGVACCPGADLSFGNPGDCYDRVLWDPGDRCAYTHEQTRLRVVGLTHPLPPGMAAQTIYELFVGDEVVARSLDAGALAGRVNEPSCARVEAVHVGTGARLVSGSSCPSADMAAQLGVRARDIAADVDCADAVVCEPSFEADVPDACALFDPSVPPPPPSSTAIVSTCPALRGPDAPPPESATSEGPPAQEDTAITRGCACGASADASPAWLLLLLVPTRRRRRGSRSP